MRNAVIPLNGKLGMYNMDNKFKNKKLLYFVIIFLIIGAAYIYIAQKFGNERNKRLFIQFDTTNIHGVINNVGIRYHGSYFKIIGNKNDFVFFPNTGKLNGFNIFDQLAQKGDSIIKPAYSDTLVLIKNNKKYLYTFGKF